MNKRTSYSLRLHPSLLEEARQVAAAEDMPLSQLFKSAIAEKVSSLRRKRAREEKMLRAASNASRESVNREPDRKESAPILDRPGKDAAPLPLSKALSQEPLAEAWIPGPNVAASWSDKFRPRYWILRRP